MIFFGREPTIGNSNLTQSDLDRLLDLDDTYRTDYTYVTSKSYRPDGSDDYENPRMSRLPLKYYRRKWAFEKARKAGLLYYLYFFVRNFLAELISNPVAMIFAAVLSVLRFIIRVLWYIISAIFPNPEGLEIASEARFRQTHTSYSQQRRLGSEKQYSWSGSGGQAMGREREFRPSPSPGRVTTWHAQTVPSTSLIGQLGRFLANVVTLGYYSDGNIQEQDAKSRWNSLPTDDDDSDDYDDRPWQGRSSFNPQHDSSRNVRRRVRTSNYEYSEDREPNIVSPSAHVVKPPKTVMESLIYKLFTFAFVAALSPLKTVEYTAEKVAWLFGLSHPTYDLRSRKVYKNQPVEEKLPYSDRVASYLAGITTSCIVTIFPLAVKILFLPINVFSYIAGRTLGSDSSNQSLQRTAGASARRDYLPGGIFRFIIDVLSAFVSGFISFFSSLQTVPYHIAENIRERIAYALANMFGSRAAMLAGFEEVRPVTKRVVTNDLNLGKTRQKVTRTTTYSESRLFPTKHSTMFCSAFWKWLFPLLVLLFLIHTFSGENADGDGLIVSTVRLPCRVLQNLCNFGSWSKSLASGVNFAVSSALNFLLLPFRLLCDLFYYPSKLVGALIHPRDAIEKIFQLPRYVYQTGRSIVGQAVAGGSNDSSILFRIPNMVYSSGQSVIIHFLEGVNILGGGFYRIIHQVFSIPEWFLNGSVYKEISEGGKGLFSSFFGIPNFFSHVVNRIFGNFFDTITSVWELSKDVGQLMLALPSYFISRAVKLVPFVNQRKEDVKWSAADESTSSGNYDRGQAEWNLDRLRYEKELLESKMAQLRRERELEENRYKDIHEAIRLVGETPLSQVPPATNERIIKSAMVNEELLQHKIEKDFQNYVANLKRTEDAELSKRLLGIEKRLVERLNTLSKSIENEVAQKITHTSQEADNGHSSLSTELSELSSAVANLRNEFDKLRREKETKIAEFAHAIMTRDTKQGDDLNMLKIELNNKIKDDLEKGLSSSLSRFEKASHEEREAFRLEIMRMVENRVVTLFASHLAERSGSEPKSTATYIPGLSESDFMIIKRMITDALDTYDADKTGKVDYALESSGASVISTRCTEPYKENSRLESIFGIPLWYSSYSPRAVIQHRPLAAGECWAFRGKGYLTIKLSHPIYVTEVSYEHMHSTLHPEGVLRSAPKLFQIYSYKAVDDLKSKFLLGEYEYDIKGRALQTFRVQNEPNVSTTIVELVVLSNWDSDYTCLYRFRVHGQKAN